MVSSFQSVEKLSSSPPDEFLISQEDVRHVSYLNIILSKVTHGHNTTGAVDTTVAKYREYKHDKQSTDANNTQQINDNNESTTIPSPRSTTTSKDKCAALRSKNVPTDDRKLAEETVAAIETSELSMRLSDWSTTQLTGNDNHTEEKLADNRSLRRHRTHLNLNDAVNELGDDSDSCLSTDNNEIESDNDCFGDSEDNYDDDVIIAGYYGNDKRYTCSLETIEEEPEISELYITADEALLLSPFVECDVTTRPSRQLSKDICSPEDLNIHLSVSFKDDGNINKDTENLVEKILPETDVASKQKRGMRYNIRDQTIVSIGDSTSSIEATTSDSGVDTEPEQGNNSGSTMKTLDTPITDSFDLHKYLIGECEDLKTRVQTRSRRCFHSDQKGQTKNGQTPNTVAAHPLDNLYTERRKEARKTRFTLTDLFMCGCTKTRTKRKRNLWNPS